MPEKWITTADAANISGYNEEYIRRLARTRKIKARKFGTIWQVNSNSMKRYYMEANKALDQRVGPRS